MNATNLLKSLLLAWVVLSGGGCADHRSDDADRRPNIIFLLTDDHRWDALGSMGNPVIRTPHLDELARGGYLFRNAYTTTSICAVSRASILSGQYMAKHGIDDFSTDFSTDAFEQTYPMVLKQNGYRVGFIGKFGVGKHPPANRFDFWSCTEKGQPPYIYQDTHGAPVHHTDSIGRDIAKFLISQDTATQPFCLSVSFKAPHELDGRPPKYVVQEEFADWYDDTSVPVPESAKPQYWDSLPAFFRAPESIARYRWETFFSNPETYQESVKDYYRLISGVDAEVGKLMVQLRDHGLDENTVIIFMGDNGFYLGEHGLEGKWFAHEESIRVPLIIYDPRKSAVDPGRALEQIALNVDIAPTILSLAGISNDGIPIGMQGVDLTKSINHGTSTRKRFYYEHRFYGSPQIPASEAVVSVDYKYIRYPEHHYEEFFDLTADRWEIQNQMANNTYADSIASFRRAFVDLKEQASQ
ncbi:sulfatase family protein [Parapedobacter sp. 10938]|uniref:sulfatase family protein n=1 Tax=Parapedobacter flavus TaxID=3110225 RepID=UPI002DB91D9B|nr:sulfatase [Parapedobacter sp. 10938]MEC3878397.1 sulfatase [Parapedobacter sp. 10938]